MVYKNIRLAEHLHICKLSKFRIVKDADDHCKTKEEIINYLSLKNSIETSKKAFFSLFEDDAKKHLKELEKKVNKAYVEFTKKTPMILENRNLIECGLNHDDELEKPIVGHTYRGIYRFKREDAEFIPNTESNNDSLGNNNNEDELMERFGIQMQALAKLLYAQEEYVKFAIETSLKDERLRDAAIEMALYIGYINKNQKEELKEIKRSR